MIQGVYSVASAMDVAQQAQDTTAQNLANANVPGYRARSMAFESFDRTLTARTAGNGQYGAQVGRQYSSFQAGALQFTGNPLDVAVSGDAFLVVQGPSGPLYTRNGALSRNLEGQLVTQSGLPLLSDSGPMTIPSNATSVQISEDGSVKAGGSTLGKIQLARFADPSQLQPAGTTLFSAPSGVQAETVTGKLLKSGHRESSNVQPATELISMIANTRYSDAAGKALRALSDALQLSTRP